MNKDDVVKGMTDERTALTAALRAPGGPAPDGPTMCEGWQVRHVVAHLVGVCADVLSGNLADAGTDANNQRQVDERAGKSFAELLEEWEQVGPAVEASFAQMTSEFWDTEMPKFGTIGLGVTRLLYDLWTHANDILIPHGVRPPAGLGARASLDIIAFELPRRLRKTAPSIGSLSLNFDDVSEQIVIGDGEDIKVTGDLNTFLLFCVGREDARNALDEGRLAFDPMPDADLATAFNIYGGR